METVIAAKSISPSYRSLQRFCVAFSLPPVSVFYTRSDEKEILYLEWSDLSGDAAVHSKFRGRIVAGGNEKTLLLTLLDQCRERRLLRTRGKQLSLENSSPLHCSSSGESCCNTMLPYQHNRRGCATLSKPGVLL
jgi:hypothetical protein